MNGVSEAEAALVAEIYKEMNDYVDLHGEALPLYVLNRRYGMRAKQVTGEALKTVLSRSGRFLLMVDKKFRTLVSPL